MTQKLVSEFTISRNRLILESDNNLNVYITDRCIVANIGYGLNTKDVLEYKFTEEQLRLIKIVKNLENYHLNKFHTTHLLYTNNIDNGIKFLNNISVTGICSCHRTIMGCNKYTHPAFRYYSHSFKIIPYKWSMGTMEDIVDYDNLIHNTIFMNTLETYGNIIIGINYMHAIKEYINIVKHNSNINHELAITSILRGVIQKFTKTILELREYIGKKLEEIGNRLQKSGCGITSVNYNYSGLDAYLEKIKNLSLDS